MRTPSIDPLFNDFIGKCARLCRALTSQHPPQKTNPDNRQSLRQTAARATFARQRTHVINGPNLRVSNGGYKHAGATEGWGTTDRPKTDSHEQTVR